MGFLNQGSRLTLISDNILFQSKIDPEFGFISFFNGNTHL